MNIRRTITKFVAAGVIATGAVTATAGVAGAQAQTTTRDSVCATIEARLHTLLSMRIKMRNPVVLADLEKQQQDLEAFYRAYCPQYG